MNGQESNVICYARNTRATLTFGTRNHSLTCTLRMRNCAPKTPTQQTIWFVFKQQLVLFADYSIQFDSTVDRRRFGSIKELAASYIGFHMKFASELANDNKNNNN